MNPILTDLSAKLLRRAARVKEKLDALHNEFNRILGAPAGHGAAPQKRRKMSAAGRANIAAAVRARWAKLKGRKSSMNTAKRPRRKMSAAAKAKLAASARARWRKAKAQGRTTL
jgi:hypothetical protein